MPTCVYCKTYLKQRNAKCRISKCSYNLISSWQDARRNWKKLALQKCLPCGICCSTKYFVEYKVLHSHYSQAEIDHLFISIVLPNFNYALAVYGASESDLTVVQNFLDRCHKRRFISFPVSIKNLLIKQDRNILKKLRSTDCHPLKHITPVQKTYVHNLRKKGCARPKINTERFMNTFVNRLIFKLHLL